MNADRKFIAWDWNGTLLDDTAAVLDCVNMAMQRMDRAPISMQAMQEAHDIPLLNLYRTLGIDEEKLEEAVGHNRAVFLESYETMCDRSLLRDGAADMLRDLQNRKIANLIVSNHRTTEINRILVQRDIQNHFHYILAYEKDEVYPHRIRKGEKLRHYITTHCWDAGQAMIVGDTVEEIEIARALGAASVAITGGLYSEKRLRALRPDHVVHSLHELRPILQERGFLS